MSIRIQYACLKQQCWLYRRNYPKELQSMFGAAYKPLLKTGDARVAATLWWFSASTALLTPALATYAVTRWAVEPRSPPAMR